jgi:guanylate kinase
LSDRKGLIIALSAPSGTGKGTLVRKLLQQDPGFRQSVSVTTRLPRAGEAEGGDYYFRTEKQFDGLVRNKELLEWDEYCGHRYGTPKDHLMKAMGSGLDILLEITVDGAFAVKEAFPEAVTVFLLPPSLEELRRRITERSTEDEGAIEDRLAEAKEEISRADRYDYLIVNDDLDTALDTFRTIIAAERRRTFRNIDSLNRFGGNEA